MLPIIIVFHSFCGSSTRASNFLSHGVEPVGIEEGLLRVVLDCPADLSQPVCVQIPQGPSLPHSGLCPRVLSSDRSPVPTLHPHHSPSLSRSHFPLWHLSPPYLIAALSAALLCTALSPLECRLQESRVAVCLSRAGP